MKKFLKKIFIFFLPLIIIFIVYIRTDPFKVIRNYKIYLSDYIMLDRGFVSAKVFLRNYKKFRYNSFIFGSSRSCAFTAKEWQKYLDEGSIPYSFGAWNETIEGIYRKIKLIDSINNPINNVLLIIDTDYTFKKKNSLKYEHYLVSGKSLFKFHFDYFVLYIRKLWLIPASVDYELFHKKRKYMHHFIGMKPGDLDPVTNDWLPKSEEYILKDSIEYYRNADKIFYKRPATQQEAPPQIDIAARKILLKMKNIFDKHNTRIKIIISPLYDQVRINHKDLDVLREVFGRNNIYDFSGINDITNNVYNYNNDVKHYRKRTANKILTMIYKKNNREKD